MRRVASLRLAMFAMALGFASTGAEAQESSLPVRTIALSVDDDVAAVQWLIDLFRSELEALTAQDFSIRIPDHRIIGAGGTRAGARAAHDALLADPDIDLIVALGPLVSAEMLTRTSFSRPVVVPFAFAVFADQLPRGEGGGSGVENLCYVEPVFDFAHDVRRYRELVDFTEMAVVGPPGLLDAMAVPVEAIATGSGGDLRLQAIPLADDPRDTVTRISRGIDAAYLIGLPLEDADAITPLLDALHERGIATFSAAGELGVRRGALAGLTPSNWWPRLMRRSALDARKILVGEDAASIPVQLMREESFYLNMATTRRLGISPTFELMSDAELLGDLQREPDRRLDLPGAMRAALANNREVQAARRALDAGREDVSIAWSAVLPQIEATLGYRIIDEDRATQVSAGAERTLVAGAGLTQVLWSERALAGIDVQRAAVRALEAALRQQELDVLLEAASSYFDVLSASAVELIRRETLRHTRSNLERARVRLRLGAASPAEEYRWESQVAQDLDALVTSIAQRNLAEIELNRVLHLPLESKTGIDDPVRGTDVSRYLDPRFLPYVDDPAGLRTLRGYVTDVALEASPELAQIDAAIAVQRRLLASETRSFFSPELALTGTVTQTIERGGAGAAILDGAPIDDTDWEVQLGLRLPVFEGTRRLSQRTQYSAEIARLEHQRQAAAERVEQRVRSSIHVASASFTRIRLASRSEDAARRNFDLVADAYAQGAVSIIEQIDAQTAWTNAQQQAASAAFRFLGDVMEVERASGGFMALATPAEVDALFEALAAAAADPTVTNEED